MIAGITENWLENVFWEIQNCFRLWICNDGDVENKQEQWKIVSSFFCFLDRHLQVFQIAHGLNGHPEYSYKRGTIFKDAGWIWNGQFPYGCYNRVRILRERVKESGWTGMCKGEVHNQKQVDSCEWIPSQKFHGRWATKDMLSIQKYSWNDDGTNNLK